MQVLYFSTNDWQSFTGSSDLENSMQSSRADFSSLQTQQGCRESQSDCHDLFLAPVSGVPWAFRIAPAEPEARQEQERFSL